MDFQSQKTRWQRQRRGTYFGKEMINWTGSQKESKTNRTQTETLPWNWIARPLSAAHQKPTREAEPVKMNVNPVTWDGGPPPQSGLTPRSKSMVVLEMNPNQSCTEWEALRMIQSWHLEWEELTIRISLGQILCKRLWPLFLRGNSS